MQHASDLDGLTKADLDAWYERTKQQEPEHVKAEFELFAWIKAGQPDEDAFRAGFEAGINFSK